MGNGEFSNYGAVATNLSTGNAAFSVLAKPTRSALHAVSPLFRVPEIGFRVINPTRAHGNRSPARPPVTIDVGFALRASPAAPDHLGKRATPRFPIPELESASRARVGPHRIYEYLHGVRLQGGLSPIAERAPRAAPQRVVQAAEQALSPDLKSPGDPQEQAGNANRDGRAKKESLRQTKIHARQRLNGDRSGATLLDGPPYAGGEKSDGKQAGRTSHGSEQNNDVPSRSITHLRILLVENGPKQLVERPNATGRLRHLCGGRRPRLPALS